MSPLVSEMQPVENMKLAILSKSGVGKTWFAATFPNVAFIDIDKKIRTVAQPDFKKMFPNKQIRYYQFADKIGKDGIFKSATAYLHVVNKIQELIDDDSVRTIVIDTMTSLSKLAMHLGLQANKISGRSLTLERSKREWKMLLFTQADYGAEMNLIEQLMDQLVDAPKHIIVNTHLRFEKNEKGATIAATPLITGDKLREKYGQWFTEVWLLKLQGIGSARKRILQTGSDGIYSNLNSTLGLPHEIENPTYEKIVKLLGHEPEPDTSHLWTEEEDESGVGA